MLTARDAIGDRVDRPRRGRRRLPAQAVRRRRAARPAARARPARGAGRRPAVLEVGDLRLDPAARIAGAAATRCRWRRRSSRCSRRSCAARASCSPATRCSSCVGPRVRESLERRRRLRALPAREGRPPVRPRVARDGARARLPPGRGVRRPAVRAAAGRGRVRARDGRPAPDRGPGDPRRVARRAHERVRRRARDAGGGGRTAAAGARRTRARADRGARRSRRERSPRSSGRGRRS